MSYLAAVAELEPYFYFPMTEVGEDNFPLDLSGNSESNILGFFEYKKKYPLLGRFLSLTSDGSISFLNLGSGLENSTLCFWLFFGKNSQQIINIAGLSLQSFYSDGVFSIVADSAVIAQFSDPRPIFISIVFDEAFESGFTLLQGFVYVNGDEAWSFPAQPFSEISFGGQGDLDIAEVSFFKKVLSDSEILSLSDVGLTGSDIFALDSGSRMSFSGDFKSHFQTVWQAYGIITTKR